MLRLMRLEQPSLDQLRLLTGTTYTHHWYLHQPPLLPPHPYYAGLDKSLSRWATHVRRQGRYHPRSYDHNEERAKVR